ncbi:hypothetical protein CXZ10_05935 [Pleomorphomonas diazotrophica]|uniref:Uncharacterized protein n=1 Tax=Pleomorphomonas diazotrophica TaxID=1166257 RepID=A0A1I4Q7Z9_9HYPH|nr:hypothetical protein [Pleomorphomonas diazotrophica]PKR90884.1 hypothetical protein CXZ10_05935 [Pleomorphomonas diazotrophica]SFM35926.1 hypothetical protein SAMN05192571_101124 [Pleomorphomonas diazotrophica]
MTIRITDHALVRYLERVHNLDVESVRNLLLAQLGPIAAVGATMGPRFLVKRPEAKFIFQGQTLVTVIRHDQLFYRREDQPPALPPAEAAP